MMTVSARIWLRDGALWGTVGAAVVATHVAAAYWLLNRSAPQIAGLPEAVFVELAPLPEASSAPAEFDRPEPQDAAPEPEPEPEPESKPEQAPEPELTEIPLPDMLEMPDLATLLPPPADAVRLTQSSRPAPRPEPKIEPKPRIEPQEKPQPERKFQPEAPARTALEAPQGARDAAPAAPKGQTPSPRQQASWQQQVQSRVARHMQRARIGARRAGLTATLNVQISVNGAVISASLVSSTGDARLDKTLSDQASRIPNLPPPPTGQQIRITIPVRIN